MKNEYSGEIAERYEECAFRMAVFLAAERANENLSKVAREEREKVPSQIAMKRMERALAHNTRKENLLLLGWWLWRVGSRIAIVIMVFVTVGFATIMSAEALRHQFAEFLLTFHADHTELNLQKKDKNGALIEGGQALQITGSYMPSYIPKGFLLKSAILDEYVSDLNYANDEGQFISFSVLTSDALSNVDTENADTIENVSVNGQTGLLIEKEGVCTLTCPLGNYYFILTSNVSRDTVMKVAQSLSIYK